MIVLKHPKDNHCILMKIMQAHVENQRWNVQYYENLYDPELKHHSGFSASERHTMAVELLEESTRDYKDFINHHPEKAYFTNEYDAIKAIRDVIRKELRDAVDYDYNPHIVMSCLRTAAKCKKLLISIAPNYSIYSAKYFRTH